VFVFTGAGGTSPAFRFRFDPVAGMPSITATATSLRTGDTSEFSAAVGGGGSFAAFAPPEDGQPRRRYPWWG
jgi:hypothetical protein